MDRNSLKEIIEEILMELSPDTLQRYADRVGGRRPTTKDPLGGGSGETGRLEKQAQQQHKAGDVAGLQKTAKTYQKRMKGLGQATRNIDAKKRGQLPSAAPTPRVKNPETGQEILATTAYKAGPQHPAYAAAKSALKKEIVSRMNESTGFIRMKDLLNESMAERRINLVRVQTIMEKLYPELGDTQTKKLMELCTEVHMIASQLNMTPYIRTESSMVEWSLLVAGFRTKLQELKEEVVKVCEEKKIDPTTAVRALDEVLAY